MIVLKPKNWAEFQHYKDRAPPWIKLHRGLLDDRRFQRLPLGSRALAPMLWLLASESKEGTFGGDIEDLAFRLRANEAEIQAGLDPLIQAGFFAIAEGGAGDLQAAGTEPARESSARREQAASTAHAAGAQFASEAPAASEQVASTKQANCQRIATPETETEQNKEEGEYVAGKAADVPACRTQEVIDAYHAALPELPRVKLLTNDRKKAVARMWRWLFSSKKPDGGNRATTAEEALAWFGEYFARASQNDFLMGRNPRDGKHADWKAHLDFLLTERGMKHVIERTEVPA